MGHWLHRTVIETGRLPLLCFFLAVIVTFTVIRLSVRMIRAQVRWWPGNLTPGGMHIHHMVFGVVFMVVGGLAGFALPDRSTVGLCVTAAIFGAGVALVLDEFALILRLQDVYWTAEGRESVDAVFVAVAVTGLLLVGLRPDVGIADLTGGRHDQALAVTVLSVTATVLVAAGFAGVTLLKGKVLTGLVGLFFPIFLVVGAVRLARPRSPWARWRYRPDRRRGERKLEEARNRETRYRQPVIRLKDRVEDLIAGRPSASN
ncbi:MAG TPA: hypothetical protein VHA75_19860 [Rugosimonospora sp.]|nr:hypothetical protein [Rugosimonospora sp.]